MSDEVLEARSREEGFISNVSGKTPLPKKKSKVKFYKTAPLLAIGAIISLIIGFLFASQSLMPFAIVNRFREEFNAIGISSTLRSDNILDYQLSDPAGFLGLSRTQRSYFNEFGIIPVDASIGEKPFTALVFEQSKNKYSAVVPQTILDSADAATINSVLTSEINSDDIQITGTPVNVPDAKTIPSFMEKYTNASKVWRGGSSGWYDTYTNLTEARLSITRSRFVNWETLALNGGTKEAWKKLAAGDFNLKDNGVESYGKTLKIGEDGTETEVVTSENIDSDSLTSQTTADGVRNALNSKIASVLKVATTVGCVGADIGTTIYTVMSAQQSMQYLNLATGYFEAVQAVQQGTSDGAPMNEYNDLLTKKDPKTKKNGIEAAGIASIFSKTQISPSDESVKMVNFETLMSSIGTLSENIALNARVIEACSYARMGVAAADFVGTIMSFVPILGQATTAIHIVAKVVGKIAIGVAVGTVVSFIVPKIIDQVIANITKNAATDWVGLDYGNALASGAIKYLGGNFQTGGGTAASEETFLVYNRYKEQVLAEAAEIDRFTRSPFDISSKNTFLGSIVYNLIPFANASTISGSLKTFGGLISNSFSNILPSASAIAETNLMESVGECPLLESVGLIGDAFCNPYYITNTSTIAESPESIEQKVAELDPSNFSGTNSNGTKKINPKSSLGKKILVCDQRVAALGIADASATNILVKQPSALVANTVLIGDIAEFISASKQAENMPWISGEACGDSPNNPYREEIETYQRYTEDLRLFEAAGIIEKSPVTSMLEDYYQENPLDNSYEGVLARYSGLEKDDVIAALDYIDALTYLANYNPSLREDFNRTSETETTKISPIERAYAKMNTNGEQLGLFTERRGFFSRKEHELLA